ncbi:hypothetical protein ARAF_0002 [Arsenophonus endosymbiont of Aleurodicus floccissimus]|nr:hypothetical protein ARAF_0002 [Arsenophonus endosymbiont of Aleurodicus floccissimus]
MFRISKEENILFSSLEPNIITEEQAKIKISQFNGAITKNKRSW